MKCRRKGLRYECMCKNAINLNTIFQDPLFILLCFFDLSEGCVPMILNEVEKPKRTKYIDLAIFYSLHLTQLGSWWATRNSQCVDIPPEAT